MSMVRRVTLSHFSTRADIIFFIWKLRLDLYVRGNLLEIFVDRQVALTHRQYFNRPFTAQVYVEDGVVTFRATLATRGN
jgi:hypothetical protein